MIINDKQFFDKIFQENKNNLKIAILGDTISIDKKAFEIKQLFISNENLFCIDKEIENLNFVNCEIDVLILCMNPFKSINILNDYKNLRTVKNVIIQPGAGSEEIENLLNNNKLKYTNGCVLKYFSEIL
ncbi:MAG: CoA-binding protein [Mycoplasma sp.]